MNIVKYLITELQCDPKVGNRNDSLLLHIACRFGHLNLTKYFITEQNCDPESRDKEGWTPLHHASQGGHMNIVKYLITELQCDPTVVSNDGSLPLHFACLSGYLSLTKYFIAEQNCDPTSCNSLKETPLHYAFKNNHKNIVQYIITTRSCDNLLSLTMTGDDLDTLIFAPHVYFLNYLVRSTLSVSNLFSASNFDLNELFHTIASVKNKFPIHSFSKVILTGNSAAGKTTLTAVIAKRASSGWLKFGSVHVQQEKLNTTGIHPSYVMSKEMGNLVLYDLAGHAEYHSSHYAIMETVLKQSPAIFISLVDLSKPDTEIEMQLSYWLNFIDNATCRMTDDKLCFKLIIVGSHADLLTKEMVCHKLKIVDDLVQSRVPTNNFSGLVSMDCRKIDSKDTRIFTSLLFKIQQDIVASEPLLSLNCHFLYAVLQWKWKCVGKIYWKLENLATFLDQEHSACVLPSEISLLNDLLLTLSRKGVIMYLQNRKDLTKTWIVVDTEALLNKIIGELLAPRGYKRHHEIASDAGIVHSSSLQQLFPDYELEMLIGFLEVLELCHHVNLSGNSTNLAIRETHTYTSFDVNNYLFFPSLLSACRPRTISEGEFSFGWCLSLKNQDYQFFTSRFLHVLLLRLAYTFPLANVSSAQHVRHAKYCTVWVNGIFWDNAEGIRTVVELIDNNQCVVVAMSHWAETRQLEYLKHRSSVIRLVLDLLQELGPHLNTSEYLIDQPLLKRLSNEDLHISTDNLLPIENVCKSMLLHKPYILTNTGVRGNLSTKQILKFEPYYRLSPSSVCELMDSSKTDADEPVSPVLLREMRTCYEPSLQLTIHNYTSLRECLDKMSLFAGRNPIVST